MLLCDCILIESLINLTFNKKDLNHWSEAIPNFEIQSIGANYQIYFLNFQIQKSKFLNVQAFNTKSKIQFKISNSKMDPKSIPHRIQIISKLPKLHSTFKSSKIFQLRTLKFPQHHLNLHQTISNKSPNLKLHLEFPISTIFSSILENSFSSYLIKLHRSFDKISDEFKKIFFHEKRKKENILRKYCCLFRSNGQTGAPSSSLLNPFCPHARGVVSNLCHVMSKSRWKLKCSAIYQSLDILWPVHIKQDHGASG